MNSGNNWRKRIGLLLLLSLAAATLLLAACGGDDDDSSGDDTSEPTATREADNEEPTDESSDDGDGSDLDVCALLTEDEVSEVLGEEPVTKEDTNFPPVYSCAFDTESGVVTVTVVTSLPGSPARVAFEAATADGEEVDGLGDAAAWLPSPVDTLEVLDGDNYVSISVFKVGEDLPYQELSTQLAEKILDRLD